MWKKDDPWLSYELNAWATIDSVQIFNREGYEERMGHFQVWVGDAAGAVDAASGATLCHDGVAAADAVLIIPTSENFVYFYQDFNHSDNTHLNMHNFGRESIEVSIFDKL